uniref:Uncharacterized protein n=1 Tax=Cacopsylla melanoneura TaxID=428564 RepID=A0A8D8RRI8_9HEMI
MIGILYYKVSTSFVCMTPTFSAMGSAIDVILSLSILSLSILSFSLSILSLSLSLPLSVSLSLSLFSCALFFIAFCVCRKRFVFLNCYIFCKLMNNNILVVKINSINKI